jgi:hypothetical protein
MGGIAALQVLKPREGVELRAPISSWGDIPSPAATSFKVFSTELFEAGTETPQGLAAATGGIAFQGTVTFEVSAETTASRRLPFHRYDSKNWPVIFDFSGVGLTKRDVHTFNLAGFRFTISNI